MSRSSALRTYWANVKNVSRQTGQRPAFVRQIYKGNTQRLSSVIHLKQTGAAFRRDVKSRAVAETLKRYPYLNAAEIKKHYKIFVKYAPGSLERIAVVKGGKRPADIPAAVWKKLSYVPKSGYAKGMTVIYRHKSTGQYYGLKDMRRHYETAYAMKYVAQMPELFTKSGAFNINQMPYEFQTLLSKTALKRGYLTEAEAVRFVRRVLRKAKEDWLYFDILYDLWPALEDIYERGT